MIITILQFIVGALIGFWAAQSLKKSYIKQEKYYIDNLVNLNHDIDKMQIQINLLVQDINKIDLQTRLLTDKINSPNRFNESQLEVKDLKKKTKIKE